MRSLRGRSRRFATNRRTCLASRRAWLRRRERPRALADRRQRLDGRHARARAQSSRRSTRGSELLSVQGAAAADRGAPIVALAPRRDRRARGRPARRSSSTSTPTSRSSPTTSRGCWTASTPTRLSGSRAGARSSSRTATGAQRHVTGSTVWGASRAFRWACLQEILPFEERVGWDGIDEFKANARGWTHAGLRGPPVPAPSPRGRARRRVAGATKPGPCRVLRRLPPLVSRPAFALQRAARARRSGDDRRLRRRRRPPGAAQPTTWTRVPTFVASRAFGACGSARSRRPDAATARPEQGWQVRAR